METQGKINIALIIALIAGFTYTGISDVEPTHYCEVRELKAYCFDLSGTEKTCYTLPEKTGGKRCSSLWKEIPATPTTIAGGAGEANPALAGAKYICDSEDCNLKG